MATFDEKEMLYDEIYSDIKALMARKKAIGEQPSEEWQQDSKTLYEFRKKIAGMKPEEINYDEALKFYEIIKAKYQKLPDVW